MFGKKLLTMLVIIVLAVFVISSCEQEKAPEIDPNTLPMALFFIEKITYTRIGDNMYAKVIAHNNSSYSNRWEWNRPGSVEKVDTIYRPVKFMTQNKDSVITQYYAATNAEQKYLISLTAFSDIKVPDTTFTSHPHVEEVKIKIPKER